MKYQHITKIERSLSNIKLFELFLRRVNFHNIETKNKLLEFLDVFVKYNSFDYSDLISPYERFLKIYNEDVKFFLKHNEYPAIKNGSIKKVRKMDYYVALILSTLMSQHRFEIMNELKKFKIFDNALVVGCGIGVDLHILNDVKSKIDAYDLKIENFCLDFFKNINFFKKDFFSIKNKKKYDKIFLIELLEHLQDPFTFIEKIKGSLSKEGTIILTLAVDIPQFDHLFNFNNYVNFNRQISKMNLFVKYERHIKHENLMNGLSSSNIFIELSPC